MLRCALVPLLVVLVQVEMYWLLARSWVANTPLPIALAAFYRIFRNVDAVLLFVGLIGVLAWLPDHVIGASCVVVVWTFGVVEYVNYFVVRLAYPLNRWFSSVGQWRTPQLVQDMNSTQP